ncbi:hypothetical protein [Sulfurivirga sp.]|uniref:hypothetical protein n=1 Tax=Sulfurivirga sp. TaxID=2614236 RepID=UPI0025D1FD71|nr:hypothetical protein [Sulfurivirga sp.]
MRKFLILLLLSLLPFVAGAGEQVRAVSNATPAHAAMQMGKAAHDMACCDGHTTQCATHDCDQGCDASCFLTHCTSSAHVIMPMAMAVPELVARSIAPVLIESFHSVAAIPVTPPPRV